MRPLRILMTLDAVGGVWRYAMDLGGALAARGHRVIFAGLGPAPSPAQRQEAAARGILEWGAAPLDWMADRPGALSDVPAWLETLTRTHRPDLLHLNLPSQAADPRQSGAQPDAWAGPPRVVVTHSCLASWFRAMEGSAPPDHLAWQTRLTRTGLCNAHRVVAPSAAHAALTRTAYGLNESPRPGADRGADWGANRGAKRGADRVDIAVAHNAGRSPLGTPDEGDGRVIAAARWWDKAKNGDALDRAAAQIRWPVILLGSCEGPGGQRWAPARARAAGALPHDETLARIASASLFVSPSLYEPFGLAALEAARAARPLLLADIPVYRELWDGAARFFDPRDPDGLAWAIKSLMHTPRDRRALGAAAQRRARRYALSRQANTMIDIYREVTAQAAVRRAS
ncbi:glycosyltransferase [Brevirhabdus sp.]|uniref:glycosyltransferase n=1 Tax=Brevirhabdus sp. TaxID=2004514 RepID=UPI004058828F